MLPLYKFFKVDITYLPIPVDARRLNSAQKYRIFLNQLKAFLSKPYSHFQKVPQHGTIGKIFKNFATALKDSA